MLQGSVQASVFEERPRYVTLALYKRPKDTCHHGGRAQSPTTAEQIPSLDAELLEVEDVDRMSQGSLDSSLGVLPPPLPDSNFAASDADIPMCPKDRSHLLSEKVQEALVSTRIVVELFCPTPDDMVVLEMLKNSLQGDKPVGADFFSAYGGHRVVVTFKTILGEPTFKDLNAFEQPDEESEERQVSEKHVHEIDSALKMILAIPKDVVIQDVVQENLKPLWARVCEHADLNIDGTPRKNAKENHVETTPVFRVVSADVGSLQQRRMSSRIAAQYVQQTNEESSRGLRRSKRTRPEEDVAVHDGLEEDKEEDAPENQEDNDKEAGEDVDASQSQQPEKQSHLDVGVRMVTEQEEEKSKDHIEEGKVGVENKKREREDIVELHEEDPDVSHGRTLLALMEEDAKLNVDLLESLTKDAKKDGSVALSIPMEDLTPPSADAEAERAERLLCEDGGNLSSLEQLCRCLVVDDLHEYQQKPVERIGVLMRWWRLVRRSFAFVGLWWALEKKQKRTKKICRKSLKEMYLAKMKELQSHSSGDGGEEEVRVYGYDQAVKYVELGEFLIQYRQFVMQTLRTHLSDWLKPLKISSPCSDSLSEKDIKDENVERQKKRRPFIDVVKEMLVLSDDSSLKGKDSVKKRKAKGKEACPCCSNEGEDDQDEIVKCSECNCLFHEHCAGYEKGICFSTSSSVGNKLEFFVGSVYCPDCLDKKQLTLKDVEVSLREQRGLAEYLNGEECPFVFKHVDRDGFCLFRNLVDFARELGEVDATDAVVCRKIIEAALKMTEALRVEVGEEAVDSDALKALVEVQQERNIVRAVQKRWLELDAEQIIRGYVQMFHGRVAVKVFRLVPSSLSGHQPKVTEQVYPEDRNGSERVLCLFHWRSLLHFDRLIPKVNKFSV